MKALITGGAGFIGSHIAQALCSRGASVVVLDNLSLGSLQNLDWKKPGDDLEFIQGDIADAALLARITPGCDWVFHEAALPSVPLSISQPLQSHADNLNGTLQVLIAARDAHVKRVIFASSSAIYGDSEVPSKDESLPPNPLSPYALQKYASEKYCQLFHQLYGLETVSLRYFNVFGPRQAFDSPYSGVIAKYCTAMLKGERPLVFGDGLQVRDFTFVENAVSANLLAAEAPAAKVAGRFFNSATGDSISLLQLIDELNRLTKQNLQPDFHPSRIGDVRHSLADISAGRQAMGYDVLVNWKAGLAQTLEFYR
ncbi:UDP-glucose 4-epimerase [Prosthecobacter fusiformis]|uniref:UDP-glucose 4-epimerase n=1 Tax=Prosthecobacter fusiformis TaxID=48464 RepID=A0A4R7STY2_9BACT|nr:NAD-dependent epimerase/dehydratase family protein [Prosthecobacter fusiformis]TDU81767.1 UDP-glucose 4-epimerase [Prosthecobacter fusiformis]